MGDLGFDVLLWLADFMAHGTIFCLDLQFLFLAMVLCKRYRLVNKLLVHVGKPWKTFRDEKPPNYVLQNILQYRFDQVCTHYTFMPHNCREKINKVNISLNIKEK